MQIKQIISIFKKKGGFELLKQYKKSKVLGFAIVEAILLGKSKKSLEILRLAIQNRTQKKIYSKNYKLIKKLHEKYASLEVEASVKNRNVWVCWLQGMEDAPELVKLCYMNLKSRLSNRNIVLITSVNFQKYVTLPPNILSKWQNGDISDTHFSDILRISLLASWGGVWIDSTVLLTSEQLPSYFDDNLFFYQSLKPGSDGKAIFNSSWVLCAHPQNPIILMTRDLLYNYWEKNNSLQDYFLFHYFFCISCNSFPKVFKEVLQIENATPHRLLLNLFEPYDEKKFDWYLNSIPVHKLTYKFSKDDLNKKNTMYVILMKKLREWSMLYGGNEKSKFQ